MNLLLFNLKTDADDSVLGFTTDWINALAKKCDRVTVITMSMGRLAVADNVQVFSIGKEKGYSEPRRLFEFYRLLIRVLRTQKIDACFAHMIQIFAILSWPLLKIKKIPIVLWYAHGHVPLSLRVATVLVDRVVASSPSGFRIKTHKFRSIGQGIDITRFTPAASPVITPAIATKHACNKIKVLTLGRISRVKRLETSLEAVALLTAELKGNIELHYIGDALSEQDRRYQTQLENRVKALSLENTVIFHPALPFHQVQKGYQAADIFVNSSDTDSMDKTVLEAMSCGLPIITSNAAFPDVFGKMLASRWCIPKDNPAILASRLEELIHMDRKQRQQLGKKFREIVKDEHSLQALSHRLIDNVIREFSNCKKAHRVV